MQIEAFRSVINRRSHDSGEVPKFDEKAFTESLHGLVVGLRRDGALPALITPIKRSEQ